MSDLHHINAFEGLGKYIMLYTVQTQHSKRLVHYNWMAKASPQKLVLMNSAKPKAYFHFHLNDVDSRKPALKQRKRAIKWSRAAFNSTIYDPEANLGLEVLPQAFPTNQLESSEKTLSLIEITRLSKIGLKTQFGLKNVF